MGELRKRLKQAFDAEGIEIPFPTSRVLFDKQQQGDVAQSRDYPSRSTAGTKPESTGGNNQVSL